MLDLELWDASSWLWARLMPRVGGGGGGENHGWVAAWMDGGSLGVERRGREGGERARSHRRPYAALHRFVCERNRGLIFGEKNEGKLLRIVTTAIITATKKDGARAGGKWSSGNRDPSAVGVRTRL